MESLLAYSFIFIHSSYVNEIILLQAKVFNEEYD